MPLLMPVRTGAPNTCQAWYSMGALNTCMTVLNRGAVSVQRSGPFPVCPLGRQLRRLRKAKYQLERDIERKQAALDIDRSMRDLSLQSAGMELVAGDVKIDTE